MNIPTFELMGGDDLDRPGSCMVSNGRFDLLSDPIGVERAEALGDTVILELDSDSTVLIRGDSVSNVVEDLAHGGLPEHLPGERDGRRNVVPYYIPWYMVQPAFIDRLQLVARFPKVCSMLVDVLWAIVYLKAIPAPFPPIDAFPRVNRRFWAREYRQTTRSRKRDAFLKMCSELCVVFFP